MKLYKKKMKKLITTIVLIVVLFNTILSSKYNSVRATQTEENNIQIKEIGAFLKENINGTIYYVQKFSINSTNEDNNYNISIDNAPKDTKILNIYNNEENIYENKIFKIAMPHNNIEENLKCMIYVNEVQYEFTKKTNVSSITAKVIFQNGAPKTNTKIELKRNSEIISEGLTDENGNITFNELYPSMYSIYEKDSNDNMVGNHPITLQLLYNEQININVFNKISDGSNIIIENEKKKGTIEIHVVDGENSNILLQNSEIEIYDSNENLIESLKTNENGIAVSSKLPIDNIYKVKQKNTIGDYIVNLGVHEVRFQENDELILVEIKNFIKKNFIKIVKVDKDNNDIKLEGVVFGIYDANNELIEEITTDRNGEAISSNLPINKQYYVKEIKALDNYVLDNNTITVFLTETENQSEEESKEVQEISINRLSKMNNFLILENQKLYDLLPKFGC